ncbi:MAG: hypothetical protein N2440_01525 [Actinobacteria bacterium]|nr:hypothetical protein [Actinomycetota bacterium]
MAVSFHARTPFDAKKVYLVIERKKEGFKKIYVMKKISTRNFSAVAIAPQPGVYLLSLNVVDENNTTRTLSKNMPILHVVSSKKPVKNSRAVIYEFLHDYFSLLPSNYKEIRIREVESVERKGSEELYRVTIEGSMYEEGREKKIETMFLLIKKGAGTYYVEYAGKNLPPGF